MSLFAASFLITLTAVLGLAIGTLLGREPIRGSCGGLGGSACQRCSGPCERRREEH